MILPCKVALIIFTPLTIFCLICFVLNLFWNPFYSVIGFVGSLNIVLTALLANHDIKKSNSLTKIKKG
jgi:hypothetical protein